ncbi:cytosolic phospholipase A2-like isoform X3 [Neoarius graeffei]|uniref:cytosolic phospholipase A2-like isoform X3 n=1 Tax=Neoarius graeffei TaxID=443677 RepID=UPI00298C8640|nr:cytosolic phospholipase A2-like isoform X3 [Neoarius graeffei]
MHFKEIQQLRSISGTDKEEDPSDCEVQRWRLSLQRERQTDRRMQNDYQQAQASWMQHIVTSLFTNSALFNTRDGRAGKVHNFILGLNLNMSISFSPFRDVLNQNGPVEEVDAVTGKLQTAAETKDDHSILVHIKDEDCVALEVQYHKSCYQQYTRFLNEPARQEKDKSLPGC